MFDKRQLKEAYKTLKIGSDWIRLDQIGSDRIRLDQIGSEPEDDLGISRSTLDTFAACFLKILILCMISIQEPVMMARVQ
jgi:hypothetical protein